MRHDSRDCPHTNTQLVWNDLDREGNPKTGFRQLREQCQACGALVGGVLKHALATPDTPSVNAAWMVEASKDWKRHWDRIHQEREREWERKRARYAEYLQSDEWRERRALVLERAEGLCEGCREKPATQVHHLTYDHIFNELLFELVAVCDDCHEHIHYGDFDDE
jgi:hypothetical protein